MSNCVNATTLTRDDFEALGTPYEFTEIHWNSGIDWVTAVLDKALTEAQMQLRE